MPKFVVQAGIGAIKAIELHVANVWVFTSIDQLSEKDACTFHGFPVAYPGFPPLDADHGNDSCLKAKEYQPRRQNGWVARARGAFYDGMLTLAA
ncbi:MAG TPA: hypothetical protein VGR84_13785 [Candidatus Acidoferrales bacterium]|nr:hypothetical protein [Candidatus Acidoferrales bacterium]